MSEPSTDTATPPSQAAPAPDGAPRRTGEVRGWREVGRRLLSPRSSGGQLVVAALCGLLAFALVTQVHSNTSAKGLGTARQDDLIGILNDLTSRSDRLREEISSLQATQQQLSSSRDQAQAALDEARRRAEVLGILAGTVKAVGPGITLTINDPRHSVRADVLVDALEELRDAGAEAIQLGPVRVVASTYILDTPGGMSVDGTKVVPPYVLQAIGDPRTLATALAIPGGVVDTVQAQPGASAVVTQDKTVTISALRTPGTGR